MSVEEQEKQVRVYEPFGFVQNSNTFEFLFIQTQENQTKVESYGFETLVGRDHYPNQIWPLVMECAGASSLFLTLSRVEYSIGMEIASGPGRSPFTG